MGFLSFRLALACAAAVASPGILANSYQIVDLGKKVVPTGIDSKGEIAAVLDTNKPGNERALVFSGGRMWKEPSQHQRATTAAVSKGRVAGNIGYTPVIWVHHGEPVTLALPGTAVIGTATGINSDGDVSGYFPADENHCFVWSFATGLSQDLGLLGKGEKCEAYGIDNRGRVYGRATSHPGYRWFAFVWHEGHMHRLPELLPGVYSMAVAGNKAGDVVGWSDARTEWGEYEEHAVLWHDGVIQDLAPDDGWRSRALAINDSGTIVGTGIENAGDCPCVHALRFDANGWTSLRREVIDPQDWDLVSATGISTAGVIVGRGTRVFGTEEHGFMLIPQ